MGGSDARLLKITSSSTFPNPTQPMSMSRDFTIDVYCRSSLNKGARPSNFLFDQMFPKVKSKPILAKTLEFSTNRQVENRW